MTVPLAILAFFAVVVGFVGFPPEHGVYHRFVEPVFAAAAGYWLAGDRLAAVQWIGAAVMIGAALATEIAAALRQPPAVNPG